MSRPLTVWPAALNLAQAAEYCGLSPDIFKTKCPVRPVSLTESTRGNRYLRASLDNWLASLDTNQSNPPKRRFGERLNGGQGEARRA